jgi:hypothetical protein
MLTASAAKPLGVIEVLAAEAVARGESLRAVILYDSERGERQPEGSPLACALQRARRTVRDHLPERSQQETLRALSDERLRHLVQAFCDAWERGQVEVGLSADR